MSAVALGGLRELLRSLPVHGIFEHVIERLVDLLHGQRLVGQEAHAGVQLLGQAIGDKRLIAAQRQANRRHAVVDRLAHRVHAGVRDEQVSALEQIDLGRVRQHEHVLAAQGARVGVLVVGGLVARRHDHHVLVVRVVLAHGDEELEEARVLVVEHGAHRDVDQRLVDALELLAVHRLVVQRVHCDCLC